jgi:hypothetical protein
VPFVIQDYPLTFSVQMTPAVIRRIATETASCWFLKHEDWPGLEKISQLRAWDKEGAMARLPILIGNNALFLDFEVERGADGANTGYCFPTCSSTSCGSRMPASATRRTISSTRTCRSFATSSSRDRGSRSAST